MAERDGFEPVVPLVRHETANFCDFAFSAREAEGISEAGVPEKDWLPGA